MLAEEAADVVRARARQAGFTERQVMFVEPGFDWSAFGGELASRSLFGDRRLVELRIPGGKPGDELPAECCNGNGHGQYQNTHIKPL